MPAHAVHAALVCSLTMIRSFCVGSTAVSRCLCDNVGDQVCSGLRTVQQLLHVAFRTTCWLLHHDTFDGAITEIKRDRIPVHPKNLILKFFETLPAEIGACIFRRIIHRPHDVFFCEHTPGRSAPTRNQNPSPGGYHDPESPSSQYVVHPSHSPDAPYNLSRGATSSPNQSPETAAWGHWPGAPTPNPIPPPQLDRSDGSQDIA